MSHEQGKHREVRGLQILPTIGGSKAILCRVP